MASNPIKDPSVAPRGIERRRHVRHRFIVDLNISSESGASMHGMSFEIGAGGMSAATSRQLEVGEQVIWYPVMRARVKATVRRKNGSMYGFEFLLPTAEFQERF
jgi:PilZ domain-containing protein